MIRAPGGPTQTGRTVVIRRRDHESLFDLSGTEIGERFGEDVAGVGDQGGDGIADLLITSAYSYRGATTGGRAYVISGAFCRKPRATPTK